MDEILALFEISGAEAVAVVLNAIAIYFAFLLLVRIFGARVLAQLSTFDVVIVVMLGAVAGRSILMDVPVLPAGLLGLGTLILLEVIFGEARRRSRGNRVLNQPPIALVRDGVVDDGALSRAHVTREELASALRQAGVRRFAEVHFAIFEPNGRISVLRVGDDVDPELLRGVR